MSERTWEQIKEHYAVEKELAARLREAPRHERAKLYASVYDEMFRRVPHHPQLTQKYSKAESDFIVRWKMRLLKKFLHGDTVYLEIGPGDCSLASEVARRVKKVYAVDVSSEITRNAGLPDNFELVLSDGCSIPIPPGSVNLAFSTDLIEHLHPEDALEQLQNVHSALVRGGRYLCVTPNRLSGPHDISVYFDREATGFHLKEYSIRELSALFKGAGFSKILVPLGIGGRFWLFPEWPFLICESFLEALPRAWGRGLAKRFPFRQFIAARIVGVK